MTGSVCESLLLLLLLLMLLMLPEEAGALDGLTTLLRGRGGVCFPGK